MLFFVIPLAAVLAVSVFWLLSAQYQFQRGGVDMDGKWYVGEGLEQGDYFSYEMCHMYYNECAPFVMDFWIKEDVNENVNEWFAEVVVYDEGKTVVGEMALGKIVPISIGGSAELGTYRYPFNHAIAWMSKYATADGGLMEPIAFRDLQWNKWFCDLACPQISPKAIETVTVPAGTWEAVLLTWSTLSSQTSKVWIVDDFPFPIKANVWKFWTDRNISILEYQFELLAHEKNVQASPFEGIVSSNDGQASKGCPEDFEKGVPQLVRVLPEEVEIPPKSNPFSDITEPEQLDALMYDLASFYRDVYVPEWTEHIEIELRDANVSDELIERFFKLYPDLKVQSFMPSLSFILPSAHAQSPPSLSFVSGNAKYYDSDSGSNVAPLKNTEVCAYTKTGHTYIQVTPANGGSDHLCDKTDIGVLGV